MSLIFTGTSVDGGGHIERESSILSDGNGSAVAVDEFNGMVPDRPWGYFGFVFVGLFAFFAFLLHDLGLASFLGLVAMIGSVFVIGPVASRLLGAMWPVLKVALIVLAIIAFLFPFVKGAFAMVEKGMASVYTSAENTGAPACLGRGGRLDDSAMVAAHKSLPCGSKVKVTNQKNGASVVVTIVDRGPFTRGRVIDLTKAAANRLGFSGLAPVTLEVVS